MIQVLAAENEDPQTIQKFCGDALAPGIGVVHLLQGFGKDEIPGKFAEEIVQVLILDDPSLRACLGESEGGACIEDHVHLALAIAQGDIKNITGLSIHMERCFHILNGGTQGEILLWDAAEQICNSGCVDFILLLASVCIVGGHDEIRGVVQVLGPDGPGVQERVIAIRKGTGGQGVFQFQDPVDIGRSGLYLGIPIPAVGQIQTPVFRLQQVVKFVGIVVIVMRQEGVVEDPGVYGFIPQLSGGSTGPASCIRHVGVKIAFRQSHRFKMSLNGEAGILGVAEGNGIQQI